METTRIWRQLEKDYLAQHEHPKNRLLHAIGVPAIVLSVLLALHGFEGDSDVPLVVTLVFAGSYLVFARAGAVTTVTLLVLGYALARGLIGRLENEVPWPWTLGLFSCGWTLQFLGHRIEGNRPAFLTNLIHLWVGPMALVREAQRKRPTSAREPGE